MPKVLMKFRNSDNGRVKKECQSSTEHKVTSFDQLHILRSCFKGHGQNFEVGFVDSSLDVLIK